MEENTNKKGDHLILGFSKYRHRNRFIQALYEQVEDEQSRKRITKLDQQAVKRVSGKPSITVCLLCLDFDSEQKSQDLIKSIRKGILYKKGILHIIDDTWDFK